MKFPHILLVVLLSLATAFVTAQFVLSHTTETAITKDNSYQRVRKTSVLRCGYGVLAPYFTKDAATGAFGGIWHDYTEAVADHLGVKVVWAEEVGLGDVSAALDARKIDVYCGGLWTAGKRVQAVDFLKAPYYEPMFAYVRTDDHRFDADIDLINDPSVHVSTIDGEGSGLLAAEKFPKATMVSLPQLSNYADMFKQVVTKKADVVLSAPSGAAAFIKNNPESLRAILTQPIKVFPVALAVRYGDNELRDMLNQAQEDVILGGTLDKIMGKYEETKEEFWKVARPYAAQP